MTATPDYVRHSTAWVVHADGIRHDASALAVASCASGRLAGTGAEQPEVELCLPRPMIQISAEAAELYAANILAAVADARRTAGTTPSEQTGQ